MIYETGDQAATEATDLIASGFTNMSDSFCGD